MNSFLNRSRFVAAAAGLAVAAVPVISGAAAHAAPERTASVSTDDTYLQDTFPGLPASGTTVLETVTYDRFQWLLQQSGQYAFVVGSVDAGFKTKVVAAEKAAREAGAKKVYWFDPNLSGQTGAKNIDTRNPSGIGLALGGQTVFGNTWKNLLAQYLGNGFAATVSGATVSVVANDGKINDAVDPIWDYTSTTTQAPIAAGDAVFFTYDKDHTDAGSLPDRIVGWTDLTAAADANAVATGVAADLTAVGGAATIDQKSQFDWWKAEANRKHQTSYANATYYGEKVLDDADDDSGWHVQQITYPELLHLLSLNKSGSNFVILFGGTWCHNTRAVIKDVNAEAAKNNVTVYNFDLVLDGGTTNGTNGSTNPIHVRDNATISISSTANATNNALAALYGVPLGTAVKNARPSYLYGDVVRSYFKNLVTEYDPNGSATSRVAYYPGGDATADLDVVRKLQVPFLINYQRGTGGSASATAVKGQWIQQNADASTGLPTYKEYMTEVWFTHPTAKQGVTSATPTDGDLLKAEADVAFAQEGLRKLTTFFGGLPGAVVSTHTVAAPAVVTGSAPTVSLTIANDYGRIPAGTATLTIAGGTYSQQVSQNAVSFTVAQLVPGQYPFTVDYLGDDQVLAFQESGTLTVQAAAATTTSQTPTTTGTKAVSKPRTTKSNNSGSSSTGGSTSTTNTSAETPSTEVIEAAAAPVVVPEATAPQVETTSEPEVATDDTTVETSSPIKVTSGSPSNTTPVGIGIIAGLVVAGLVLLSGNAAFGIRKGAKS